MTRHLFTIELVIETSLAVDETNMVDMVDTAMSSQAFDDVLYSHATSVGVDPDVFEVERADVTYEGEMEE